MAESMVADNWVTIPRLTKKVTLYLVSTELVMLLICAVSMYFCGQCQSEVVSEIQTVTQVVQNLGIFCRARV